MIRAEQISVNKIKENKTFLLKKEELPNPKNHLRKTTIKKKFNVPSLTGIKFLNFYFNL